ncbi:hypothetical protein C8R44DRAFT_988173 [Mycena epipterygia]|nr:hypothetical protein C8R44DRAFT_988173 [Mycena epipterygia]
MQREWLPSMPIELSILSGTDNSQASTSQIHEPKLDGPGYTESDALADAMELDRLHKLTPSPVRTELCYESWTEGEISTHFKNTGYFKIRDYAYPPNDIRHRGLSLPREDQAALPALPTPPSAPRKHRPIKPLPRRLARTTTVRDPGFWTVQN